MTPSRYLVIEFDGDRVHAIDAAIDFAEKDGKAGRSAEVLVQEDERELRALWTYGRDPHTSTPRDPAYGRATGTHRLP